MCSPEEIEYKISVFTKNEGVRFPSNHVRICYYFMEATKQAELSARIQNFQYNPSVLNIFIFATGFIFFSLSRIDW